MAKKRRKRSEYKKLKDKAWKLLSQCIRQEASNLDGYADCVTCETNDHFKRLQAGHFVDGRGNAILFDERGVHVQCQKCNIWNSGNKVMYYKFMQEKYGQEVIDDLIFRSKQPTKLSNEDLMLLIKKYQTRLERLK